MTGLRRQRATLVKFCLTVKSRLTAQGSTAGPTASFSMYLGGGGFRV